MLCKSVDDFLKVCKLTHMDSRTIIKKLLADGFKPMSVHGSHNKFRKGSHVVIVPHPKKDLPIGTINSIYKQAGWKK